MQDPKNTDDAVLQNLISTALWVFVLIFVVFVAMSVAPTFLEGAEKERIVLASNTVAAIGAGVWNFARPLLQLAVVLAIVDWLIRRWSIAGSFSSFGRDFNIQAIVALIVIGAFAVAVLSGITEGVGALKDLALVVVGFYFGTQRRAIEYQTDSGKTTIIEEHTNERGSPATATKKDEP